ncbi:YycH family regulatory protein [Oceanobacillus manasiensis]|uniref:YycH family regulatory protein n=1 Tax=Oceanobacillus manasiensis TaxID=586413 RepID=UPI0005A9B14C|nr:two-component system activity regulator YycH [Oceanobacillus manasiensis]
MRLETTKSFLLIVLIGVSLLLSFGLWTYQPSESESLGGEDVYSQGDLGGTEESVRSIIEPTSILFHAEEDTHYGFPSPQEEREFYEELQTWTMSNFREHQIINESNFDMEMRFPDALPMTLANNLFSLDEVAENLPNWSFEKIVLNYKENNRLLEVTFISVDGQHRATATINDASSFELFQSKLVGKEGLIQYVHFSEGAEEIYLPSQVENVENYTLSTRDLNVQMLVNSLFRDPRIVSRSLNPLNEPSYTDAIRELKVIKNGRVMSFINPQSSDGLPSQKQELLEYSMDSISDHGGWTNDYKLLSIDRRSERVRYQMYYKDYPVFDKGLTAIEQKFGSGTLLEYKRPLFKVTSEITPEPTNLDSGEAIIAYLRERGEKDISLENVENIRIGYELAYIDNADYLSLRAKWYMNYNGSWQPVKEENKDAMESN